MKKLYKFLFLSFFLLISSHFVKAQCDFRAGDIAFTGYQIFDDNLDGLTKDDAFSFVLLRDAPAGLEIYFTDLGWTSAGRFQEEENAPSDGLIKWKTNENVAAGTQITINSKFNLTASVGEVTDIQNTQLGHYMDLGIAGDQLFAFTGSQSSPTLLAGININKHQWDDSLIPDALSSSSSVSPLGNHAQNISIGYQNNIEPYDRKAYNAVFKPGEYEGKVSEIINQLNDLSNWVTDETVFPHPVPGDFVLPSKATFLISPPEITSQPQDLQLCSPDNPVVFSVVVNSENGVCSYLWELSTDGVEYTPLTAGLVYSGVNTPDLTIENIDGLNGNFYRVKVKGAVETYSEPAKLEVIIDDLIQSGPIGNTELVYGEETIFSFTVSEYANTYEWHVSKDEGASFQVIAEDDINYEGVKTNALTLLKPTVAMNGYQYRLLVADPCEALYSETIPLAVVKKELIITAKDTTKTYDGKPFTEVEVGSYAGFVYGDDESILTGSLTYDGEEAIGVSGNPYDIIIKGLDADNYSIVYEKGALIIEPAPLTISIDSLSKVYGDNNPELTFVYDGLVNSETSISNLSVTTEADASSSVGDYAIELTGSADNYNITFVEGTLSVTPKAVTVTAENKSKVYGDVNPALTYTYDGLVNGETTIPDLSVSTTADASSKVGDYPIEVLGTSDNYTITFANAILSITRKAVTVSAENKSKVYGDANPELTLVYDGLVNDETSIPDLSISTVTKPSSPVGDYAIAVSGTTDNYTIVFVEGILSVTPKAVTVSAENKSKVYGEANPALTLVYDGLVNDETLISGLSITTLATVSSAVGEYPIVVSGASANYDITFVDGELSITPKAVTISAENKSKVYGEVNPALTFVYDGLVNGETFIPDLSVSTEANASSPVGKYSIVVSGSADNYTITAVDGTLSVTPKTVTVRAEDKSKIYGDINPTLTLAYDGLVNGETSISGLSVSTLVDASSPVGVYPITVSGSTDNYTIAFVDGTLSVTPKNLTVRVEDKSKVYGEVNPALTLFYDGLVNGETSISGLSVFTGADASSPVGVYPIVISGTSDNYTIDFIEGALSVTPKSVTVSAENKSKVYGEANPELTFVYDGLVNGESFIPGLSVSTSADAGSFVGVYPILVSGTATNYTIAFVDGTLSVTPKTVTVRAEDKSKIYGEINPTLTLLYDGLVNGEISISELSASTLVDESSPVGVYPISVTGSTDNYTIVFVDGELSVMPKELTVIAESKSKVYGEANPVLTFTYDGLVNGETLIPDLSVSTTATTGSSVGSYPIVITGSSPNYSMNVVNGILSITPKSITITANNQTKRYNEADPELTYTVNPTLIGNDSLTGELNRELGENTGKYLIKQNTLKATSNYNLLFISGELTIVNSNIEGVIFKDRTVTYDGNKHSLSVENLPSGAKVDYKNNDQSNAGTYTVTATITQADFDDLVLNQVLTILKAEANIHADDIQSHVYDGRVKNIKASLNHSETTLIYSLQQGYLEAGTYEVTISSIETNNYLAASKKVQLIIQQANFDGLVFKDEEFTYDGKIHSLRLDNLPKGSIVEYIGNEQTDAGSYTVIAHVIHPNLKETTLSANLLIKKAKQQIIFDEVGTLTRDADRIALNISTNSGLPITIISDDNLVASIDGNELFVHRLGTIRLTASQAGDENYEAANSVSITVQVIDETLGQINVHKALSPNGDGINDFLIIEGIKDFPENRIQIFNRNGLLVFDSENYDNTLNTFQGISNTRVLSGNLPVGTYFYIVKYKDKRDWKAKQGWFVLKR